MKHKYFSVIFASILTILFINSLSAAELNINVQKIHETRSTDKLFSKLNVTLKVSGEIVENSSGILPIKINKAYCDTDTSLQQYKGITETNLFQFSSIDPDRTSQQTVLLTAPNRFNRKLFLEGEVTIYTPKVSSRVSINDYQMKTKENITNKILRDNGIKLIIFRKNEYDELLINAKKLESEAILKNTTAQKILLDKYGPVISDFIKYHNPNFLDGYDLYFIVSGNWNNVTNIEVLNTSGDVIKNVGRTLFPGNNKITIGLDFNGNLPTSGNIRIYLIQEGDTKTVPFQIEAKLP